jgi:hypothetical protein
MVTPKRRPQRVMLRVIKGGLAPADDYSASILRARGYRVGDIVSGDIKKPRNPGFHRLAHRIGSLAAENIEAFSGLAAHAVLKRLQLEGDIACENIPLNFPGVGPVSYRIPLSLSFEAMDDGEFHPIVAAFCSYLAKRYWPTLTGDQIEKMAELYVEPT